MYELAKSQHGFAISKLGPNQIMLTAENPQLSIYDETPVEGVMVQTLSGDWPLTLDYNMQNFGGIKTAVLSERTEEIGNEVFLEQRSMTVCDGTSNVKEIGNAAFAACASLEKIDLSNVEHIGSAAFAECISLGVVKLPKVTHIDQEAFAGCANAEVYLNDDVEQVDSDSFTGVKHLYYHGNLPNAPFGALAWN